MLESIVISNFAIIDRVYVEFKSGMTALTGETGAGKSILLDAIQLVLGDRADSGCVKAGSDRADISVNFDISAQPEAQNWLHDAQLEGTAGECLLRRVIQANGRSKAFINGFPGTLGQLKELGEMLVDLHGQHEHQSLQKPTVQRRLLDASLAGRTLLEETESCYRQWKKLRKTLQQARDQSAAKTQRVDLLKLYCQEFIQLALVDGEIQQLEEEYGRLSHAGQILQITASVLTQLYDDEQSNIQHRLARCVDELESLQQLDGSVAETVELTRSALIQVQEAVSGLRNYQQALDLDPARLDWLNERLSQAQGLARKHQVTPDQLFDHALSLTEELDSLMLAEEDLEQLQQGLDRAAHEYLDKAAQLSAQRRTTADSLSRSISEVMQTLGMQGGRFEIEIDSDESPANFSAHGIDQVRFLVSANPGQPLKPLGKVASGGELSRISLAIQVILSHSSDIPTLIFDEVDSGIGGGVAEIVGRKLRQISQARQVFCVTHLPQVASQAQHHLQVNKIKQDMETSTQVIELDEQQRLEEIARMLGGVTITDQTRAHAQEMISGI